MDDLKRRIFNSVWQEFVQNFNNRNTFLDFLYEKELFNRVEFERLQETQRTADLLADLHKILLHSKTGYDVFLEQLERNYDWLHASAKALEKDERLKDEGFQKALRFGNVPRPPPNFIERTQLVDSIKAKLRNLNPNYSNKIVIYGMHGIGKSCLAAAAIKDVDLLLENFDNKIYWVTVGDVNQDQLFDLMYRLYRKIVISDPDNIGKLPLDKPDTIGLMKDNLSILFTKKYYTNCLIVLDNVRNSEVVNYFDAGCNLLIVSQVKIPMNQEEVTFIPIQDHFTETESLSIFAKCLDVTYNDIKRLSGPASVHSWCKGDPMLISLCATLIKEKRCKLINNSRQWIDMLEGLQNRPDITTKRYDTINYIYDNLDSDLKSKYEDFAVFVHDINVTTEVLMTLWDLGRLQVEMIMQKFHEKCLIVSDYNNNLNTEVYGIHHVFLDFLKTKLRRSLRQLHIKLINSYRDRCNGDFASLPNDNYIFQYFGYHLSEAGMYEMFSIYFDLDFVGAKIRATGIADVLRDFTTYKDYITKNNETLVDKLAHYVSFVEIYGQNLHKYGETDIIQSGLQLPTDHPVYKAAYKVAMERGNHKLYFQMHAPHKSNYYTHVLTVTEKFKVACFTEETKEILIGTEMGQIKMCESQYMQNLQTFTGHVGAITYLKLNRTKDKFLSISGDGTVKLWNLSELTQTTRRKSNGIIQEENVYNQFLPSPHMKQSEHTHFFGTEAATSRSDSYQLVDDNIISAAFPNENTCTIATGSEKGKVHIWRGRELVRTIEPSMATPIKCVAFSNDDSIIIIAYKYIIQLFDARNGEFLSSLYVKEKRDVEMLHVIPYDDLNGVISVQSGCIMKWTWDQLHDELGNTLIQNCCWKSIRTLESGVVFNCSTITENFLVASSSDFKIRMWDIDKNVLVEEFLDQNGHVICLDASVNDKDKSIQVLLTGFEDHSIKMWHVQPSHSESKKVRYLPIFAAHWNEFAHGENNTAIRSPLIAIANSENTIEILKGHNLIVETSTIPSAITNIAFSTCGNYIFYGLVTGNVYKFTIKTKENTKIMSLGDPVSYLECIAHSLKGPLLIAASDSGKLFMYNNEKCKKLMEFDDKSKVPVASILKSFCVGDTLLTVCKHQVTVKYWDIMDEGGGCVLYSDFNSDKNSVMSTCITNDKGMLCVTSNRNVIIVDVKDVKDCVKNRRQQGFVLEDFVTCCCFSHDGAYVALGCNSGVIVIWDLIKQRKHTTLQLHTEQVRHVQFSISELILISVGEQIAWWNLKKIPENITRTSFRSRSNSTKILSKPLDLQLKMSLLNIGWTHKSGPPAIPHLLASIKLHGAYADTVSYSRDFESFLTVDNQGEIYIMDIFNDS